MFGGRLAVDHLYGKWLFMAVAGDVFVAVLLCAVLLPRDVFVRSGNELSQFLRIVLPIFVCRRKQYFFEYTN